MAIFHVNTQTMDALHSCFLGLHTKKKDSEKFFFFRVNFCFLILSFWGFLILLFLICFFNLYWLSVPYK